jgi:hypothetical protein
MTIFFKLYGCKGLNLNIDQKKQFTTEAQRITIKGSPISIHYPPERKHVPAI